MTLKAKKKGSWGDFWVSINQNSTSKEAWSKTKRIQGKKTPTSNVLKSSKIFKTNQDKAEILSTTFKNNSATSNYSINF